MNDGPVGVITRSEVVALLGRIPRLGIWLNHLSKEQGQCPWAEEPPHEAEQLGAAPPRPAPRPASRARAGGVALGARVPYRICHSHSALFLSRLEVGAAFSFNPN